MKNKKLLIRNIIVILFVILLFITITISLNYILLVMGDDLQNLNFAVSIEQKIKKENLSLPMPNIIDLSTTSNDYRQDFYDENFNKNLSEFYKVLQHHYIYDVSFYDCNYWSFVWSLYWKEKKDFYNWKIKYIYTDNHIFIMVFNESGYIIMDENNLLCIGNMGC